VHLVDGRDVLMPFLDPDISHGLAAAMAEGGVQFHWSERVVGCDASRPGDLVVSLTSGTALRCDALLVCAGRQSNTAQLNLAGGGNRPR
jgi:NAD(P) transhydrogenase